MPIDLRRAFFSRSMLLLQHPTVKRLLADPRTMDLFIAAVRTKERAGDMLAGVRGRIVDAVRDLERKVRRDPDES